MTTENTKSAKQNRPRRFAEARGYAAGERVEIVIAGHRWNGLTGKTLYGGNKSHLIETDCGRQVGPVYTHELKPHNDPS